MTAVASINTQKLISNIVRAYAENWILNQSKLGRVLPKKFAVDRVIVRKITDVALAVVIPVINGQLNQQALSTALQNTLNGVISEMTVQQIIYDILSVNLEAYIAKMFNRTESESKSIFYADRAIIVVAVQMILPMIINAIAPQWGI